MPAYLEASEGPAIRYHLPARPWHAIETGKHLDVIEGTARFLAKEQEASGRIRDFYPSAIPYSPVDWPGIRLGHFSYIVAVLLKAGRADDLVEAAIRAMDYDTKIFESYIGGMRRANAFTEGLLLAFEELQNIPAIPESAKAEWRQRLYRSNQALTWLMALGGSPNSYCYRMQTEWNRFRLGIVGGREAVVAAIESEWEHRQKELIVGTRWNLYRDTRTDPDSLSTEAAGRVNLLLLAELGYDGPSANLIRSSATRGTRTLLLLQDPSGQTPPNGRTDNHNWVDAGNAAAMEVMSETLQRDGDPWRAGQFRRGAMLALQSIQRYKRADGTYAVTKNRYDPMLFVGHQGSGSSEYIAKLATHVAQAYLARKTSIPEQPAPSEIGGYALTLDPAHSAAIANAGGMMMQVNLRGETTNRQTAYAEFDNHTPLGVVRFARPGWDTRLGPSDGVQDFWRKRGISFAPTFLEDNAWVRLPDIPTRYKGRFTVRFAHPMLVRCAVEYSGDGPAFRNEFVITPDGILSIATGNGTWGMTAPLLVYDGAQRLHYDIAARIARTSFGSDEQAFIAINPSATLNYDRGALRSAYGDLLPVRIVSPEPENRIFVYPRNPSDPSAEAVRDSFKYEDPMHFASVLGRVGGDTYIGRTCAGGVADRIDLDGDGMPEATFGKPCGFVLQLKDGQVTMIETDQSVEAVIRGRKYNLSAYAAQAVSISKTPKPGADGKTQ